MTQFTMNIFFSIQTISNVFKKYGLFSLIFLKSNQWFVGSIFFKKRNKKSIKLTKLEEYEKKIKLIVLLDGKNFQGSIIHSKIKNKISYINKKFK